MDINTINRIVWWIPFKQLRNDVRQYLMSSSNIYGISDSWVVKPILDDIEKNRNELLSKYRKLINGLDSESVDTVNNIVSNLSKNTCYNINFTDYEIDTKLSLQKKHNNKIIKIDDEYYIYDNKYIR